MGYCGRPVGMGLMSERCRGWRDNEFLPSLRRLVLSSVCCTATN